MSLTRTFHTVRHLRPIQIVNRLTRKFRNVEGFVRSVGEGYELRPRDAQPPADRSERVVAERGFCFQHVSIDHEGEDRWEPAGASRLWHYVLHAFVYLDQLPSQRARELILDWIQANPPVDGAGWEPYTLSLRVREWIEWLHKHPDLDQATRSQITHNIAQQVAALEAQIEYHLLANHLFENAITLCWAGLSLNGPRSSRWLSNGAKLLQRELAEQILKDGTHYERSPMYQSLIAESLLRLAHVAKSLDDAAANRVQCLAEEAGLRLIRSLQYLTHPDDDYALLNDTSLGTAPTVAQLAQRFGVALVPKEGPWHLTQAGYMGAHIDPGSYLVFDAGDLGPRYQPGHGHADCLSFELSHLGHRLITDTGIFTYNVGAKRSADRSTAAHNTVQIDGRDQAQLWGAFRCGRRPQITASNLETTGETVRFTGSYKGPGRGLSSVTHRRDITWDGHRIEVVDSVQARGRHTLRSALHLAPGIISTPENDGVLLRQAGRPIARLHSPHLDWKAQSSVYHPSFGVEHERVCLHASMTFQNVAQWKWTLDLL